MTQNKSLGFTLIEVMVALVVMSIMAVLTWQGIDGMARASAQHRARSDDVAAVQTALLQWRTDLDHMIDASQTPPLAQATAAGSASAAKSIEFDSRILRITRRFEADEIRVVAWGGGAAQTSTSTATGNSTRRLLRWVSEPVRTRAQWQAAWDQAARWGQNAGDADRAQEAALMGIDDWQIFYYRNNSWSNPLSQAGSATQSTVNPDGVRLVVQLSPGQQPGGKLTLDWAQPAL